LATAPRRLTIVGNVAGGKSTLGRAIAAASGIPHREYDKLLWRGRELLPDAEAFALEEAWLADPAWINDGMGAWPAMKRRLDRAEGIIFVNLPLRQHLAGAAERRIEQICRNGELEDREQAMTLETLFHVMTVIHGRTRPRILAFLKAHPEKHIVHLRNKAALQKMVENFRREAAARATRTSRER
jgi:adenylate kinase family enzyme